MEAVFLTRVLYRNSNWDLSSLPRRIFCPFFSVSYTSQEKESMMISLPCRYIYSHHRPIKRIYFLYQLSTFILRQNKKKAGNGILSFFFYCNITSRGWPVEHVSVVDM